MYHNEISLTDKTNDISARNAYILYNCQGQSLHNKDINQDGDINPDDPLDSLLFLNTKSKQ